MAILWFSAFAKEKINSQDEFFILLAILLVSFLFVPAKVSHLYSSRYVVTALVPMVLMVGFDNSRFSIFLKLLGCVVGVGSLASYYGWL
jgi:hypothetical protein